MSNHPLHLFKFCPRCGSDWFHENNFKSKKCGECEFVYYFNASAATAAFIIDSEGRLLVAKRANEPAKGTLDLPGGFADMYETAEEAISREIEEETGLKIKQLSYLFSIPNIYIYSGFEVHTVDMFFEAEVKEISLMRAADDVAALFWLRPEEIHPELFGLTSIRKAVEKWLEMCS